MFYLAAYEIFLQGCDQKQDSPYSVHKENIIEWNRDRTGIEWAIANLQNGDKILLNRPFHFNLLELIIISKLVGPSGKVSILGLKSHLCL
jgi:hypothetical protein